MRSNEHVYVPMCLKMYIFYEIRQRFGQDRHSLILSFLHTHTRTHPERERVEERKRERVKFLHDSALPHVLHNKLFAKSSRKESIKRERDRERERERDNQIE